MNNKKILHKYNISIFIFRRDLRLIDNTGLIEALKSSKNIIPLFIFTPCQVSDNNKFKSSNAIQFMVESLYDLNQQIKDINEESALWVTYGDEITVLGKIYKEIKYDAIYLNEDYTPYSKKRDLKIEEFCEDNNLDYHTHTDALLLDTSEITAKNGNYYHNFTLFYKKTNKIQIRNPQRKITNNFLSSDKFLGIWKIAKIDKILLKKKFYRNNNNLAVHGGRTNALEILKCIKYIKNYEIQRQYPAYQTTMMSPHNKFGTVSIREVYYVFLKEKSGELVRNLYWRDFYYYISIHFKELYKYNHLTKIQSGKKNIKWENNKKYYIAWKNGKTGFPLVDAAMAEINTTGFMHNRARLVASHFLVKDLLIDWKYGERYFSQKLLDIDRAQNTGNWNWSASFGLDGTPFLRILNPWTQSKKYDPKCIYIKKWLPQFRNIASNHIHQWNKYYKLYPNIKYPKPIIEHDIQRKKFIEFYKRYF